MYHWMNSAKLLKLFQFEVLLWHLLQHGCAIWILEQQYLHYFDLICIFQSASEISANKEFDWNTNFKTDE